MPQVPALPAPAPGLHQMVTAGLPGVVQGGGHLQTQGDLHACHPRVSLHPAEQPAHHRPEQPGRRNLPGHLPAQDPHHGRVQRHPAQEEAGQAAVAGPGAPDVRGDHGPGHIRGSRPHQRPEQAAGLQRGPRRLLLLRIRRGLLREARQAEQPALDCGQEPPAGPVLPPLLVHGDGVLLQRRHLSARHLLRLHPARPCHHRPPEHRRPCGGRHYKVCGQHPQGVRHLDLDNRVDVGLLAGAGGPGGGALLPPRHRHRALGQPPVWPPAVRALRLQAGAIRVNAANMNSETVIFYAWYLQPKKM